MSFRGTLQYGAYPHLGLLSHYRPNESAVSIVDILGGIGSFVVVGDKVSQARGIAS